MAELLKGKEVASVINERSRNDVTMLKEKGITPALAILRVGERSEDLSYERGATKRCNETGVEVVNVVLPQDISKDTFYIKLEELNNDPKIHGILMLRPLPEHLDNELARMSIVPEKDVDGCTDGSLTGVFTNTAKGFAPCTAQAAIEILDHYGIELAGKNVVVLGRSLVVGKPVSMLLLNRNATVTVCHSKTKNIADICKKADILVVCTGKMESVNKDYVNENQIIIDVGISFNEIKNKLCGDVLFEEVEPIVKMITPVPGGVGAVTTSVLVSHVVEAAKRTINS
ncbi:MAG: bifunctional 5,10-methylene-tetrahydrofolate dehydrogenase/5,10-methylene-tetrahydrofolate cyclohydrolase [Erysipelotrichaceae bacterium]|nr:bifunctional 5,10-methylene-tetrahydrofolate dehydrogenase/5,10-methylene-tetrahydrofolate cyclohydrolase [Erysipelotrichaceae bacterium]